MHWLILLVAMLLPVSVSAQLDEEIRNFDRRIMDLARAGKRTEAAAVANEALEAAERRFGGGSLIVAQRLDNLAHLLRIDRQYSAAEPLIKRALAIREADFGADHPDVCQSLSNLAVLYEMQERLGDVELLLQRSLAIREKAFGPDHPAVAHSLHELAKLYGQQGRSSEADALYTRAVAILGPAHPAVVLKLIARGEYEAVAPLLGVPASDPQTTANAVKKTFFGQVTHLRWTGLRIAESNDRSMVIAGEAMHGNDIWQPFEVTLVTDGRIWKTREIRALPLPWR